MTELAGTLHPFCMEHRWGQRIPCRARVQLSAGVGVSGSGRVRDISTSGAFIETALQPPVYAHLHLVVLGNDSATHTVEITATVTRVDRDGIGIEWLETPPCSVCDVIGCTTRCTRTNGETN